MRTGSVKKLNDELFTIRQHRREVEKYRQLESYTVISETVLAELKNPIAMLIVNDEADIDALRFDALMYGYMFSFCSGVNIESYKTKVITIATCLQAVITIPQVKAQLPLIERVADGSLLAEADPFTLEDIRKKLRNLIRFIVGVGKRDVITHLADPMTDIVYGVSADIGENFVDYKLKVERYLKDFGGTLVIHKLRTNKPMTALEFQELERIFTKELGNAEDYVKAYGNTPFGLLVRKLAHLDYGSAMEAFADFMNNQSLTDQQISFVKRVINYVVENGYMEPQALLQPPFDRPQPFIRMFNTQQAQDLINVINSIKENATNPAA